MIYMPGDLYIHVARTPPELAHAAWLLGGDARADVDVIRDLPAVWVGRASWVKASVFGESEPYIPQTVREIERLMQTIPVVTEALIARVDNALRLANATRYPLAGAADILGFLHGQLGGRAFAVRWGSVA